MLEEIRKLKFGNIKVKIFPATSLKKIQCVWFFRQPERR